MNTMSIAMDAMNLINDELYIENKDLNVTNYDEYKDYLMKINNIDNLDINTRSMIKEFNNILQDYNNIYTSFDDIISFVNILQLTPKECPVGYKIDDKYFYILTRGKNSNEYTTRTVQNYYGLFNKNDFERGFIPYIKSVVDLLFIDNGFNVVVKTGKSRVFKIMIDPELLSSIKLSTLY